MGFAPEGFDLCSPGRFGRQPPRQGGPAARPTLPLIALQNLGGSCANRHIHQGSKGVRLGPSADGEAYTRTCQGEDNSADSLFVFVFFFLLASISWKFGCTVILCFAVQRRRFEHARLISNASNH